MGDELINTGYRGIQGIIREVLGWKPKDAYPHVEYAKKFDEQFGKPEEVLGDSPFGGPGEAIVINPKNYNLFKDAIVKSFNYNYGDYESLPIRVANAFMKIKNPKIYGLAKSIDESMLTGASGRAGAIVDDLGNYKGSRIVLDPDKIFNEEKAVEVLAHELTHAIQHKRWGPYEYMKQTHLPWNQRWSEKNAIQGGQTALNSFKKLLDMINKESIE